MLLRLSTLLCALALTFPAFARRVNPYSERKKAAQTLTVQPVRAPSYALMDVTSGRLLESRDPRRRLFPASTTKTMTALVALRSGLPLDTPVTIGTNPAEIGESSIYLQPGESLTLRQLLQAALVKSANDACVAIAEVVAGDVPSFVAKMNETAKAVGARDTHFMNPHGLHDSNHYTTAYDLALIAQAAMKYPAFNAIVNTEKVTLPGNGLVGPTRLLMNRNRLLFRWPECDGVKTGYTRQAGKCLVASATRRDAEGRRWRLVSVVLHSPDVWSDSANLLLHQGFEAFSPTTLVRRNENVARVEARGGAYATRAVTSADVVLPLRKSEVGQVVQRAQLLTLQAPLKRGQTVGTLVFESDGRVIERVPLIARADVPPNALSRVAPGAGQFLPVEPAQRYQLLALCALVIAIGGALLRIVRRIRHDQKLKTRTRRAERSKSSTQRPTASTGGAPHSSISPQDGGTPIHYGGERHAAKKQSGQLQR